MIIERTFYSVKCDGCGKSLEDDCEYDESAWWDSEEYAREVAENADFITVRGKDYCPKCYHYGDDNELVLSDGTVIKQDEEDWQ